MKKIYLAQQPIDAKLMQLHYYKYKNKYSPEILQSIKPKFLIFDIELYFTNVDSIDLNVISDKVINLATFLYDDKTIKTFVVTRRHNDIKSFNNVKAYDTEYELLSAILDELYNAGVDIVTGWNVLFDIRYVIARALYHKLYDKLSKVFRIPRNITTVSKLDEVEFIPIAFTVIDYLYDIIKNSAYHTKTYPSYTLNYIANEELGAQKTETIYSPVDFNAIYESNIKNFIIYNQTDCELVYQLEKKFNYIDSIFNLKQLGHMPTNFVLRQSKMLNAFIVDYALQHNKVIQYNISQNLSENQETISGGYVRAPIVGLHKNIYAVDVVSQYPHIISLFNISPDTVIAKIDDDIALKIINNENINPKQQIFVQWYKPNHHVDYITIEALFNELSNTYKNCYSITPSGLITDQSYAGIISDFEAVMLKTRMEYKALAKKHKDDPKLYQFYNTQQYIRKILMNALYGVYDVPTFLGFDKNLSQSITITGRALIKFAARCLSYYLSNNGNITDLSNITIDAKMDDEYLPYIIYGDTDSLFVQQNPNVTSEQLLSFLNDTVIAEFMKRCFKCQPYHNELKFMFECEEYQKMLALAKKRYILQTKDGQFKFKGIEMVRTDYPAFSKTAMKIIIDIIFNTDNQQMLNERIKTALDSLVQQLLEYIKIGSSDIARPISIKDLSQYVKNTPAHVKGAQVWNSLYPNNPITSGKALVWHIKSYLDKNTNARIKATYLTTPINVTSIDTNIFEIDINKTIETAILNRIEPICSALNIPLDTLQMNI